MSEPAEVQTMLETVDEALKVGHVEAQVTWLLESGFDEVAVWRTIWEPSRPSARRSGWCRCAFSRVRGNRGG